jgi:hypothetical protein
MMMRAQWGAVTLCAAMMAGGCMPSVESAQTDDAAAEAYVKLVLALGLHDADYVDAYYGPPEWRAEVEATASNLVDVNKRAAALEVDLRRLPPIDPASDDAEMRVLRRQYLARQLQALRARVTMLQGRRLTFDEESRELYDATAPRHTEEEFQGVLDTLSARLPGEGPLADRHAAFKRDFIIPPARLDDVFQAAIAACRERTAAHIALPPDESFTVEYVTGKSWSGYNWYQGGYRSLIQVNTDLPIYIDRAIDLACHEGYPGHHVYNVLLEQALVRERGWVEFSVYALFSPQSLIAEGTANYGIDVAFSRADRLQFERDVLFPLAGLDPARVEEYYDVLGLTERLSYAGNEAARRYLDGHITADQAAAWLTQYAMSPPPQAAQRVRFFDQYRSYVINYNLGKDLVRQYIEGQGGTADNPERRWQVFKELLSSPRLPSGLK